MEKPPIYLRDFVFAYTAMLLVIVSTVIALSAQEEVVVDNLVSHYQSAQFEQTIEMANSLLNQSAELNSEDLVTTHKYLALAHYSLGNIDSARVHFLSVISLDPAMELDPVNTSPKIIDFYETVKREFAAVNQENGSNLQYARYVFVEDLRPQAGIRSALFPGWGQFHKGQTKRGIFWTGLFLAGVGSSVYAVVKETDSREKYLAAGPSAVTDAYDTYNFWFKSRRSLIATSAVIWSLCVVDAFWAPYARPDVTLGSSGEFQAGVIFRF